MVLGLVGEPMSGLRPVPWQLTGVVGAPLPPGATLAELGVPDGELLRLAPVAPPPAPPVFDDPVVALADGAAVPTPTTAGSGPRRSYWWPRAVPRCRRRLRRQRSAAGSGRDPRGRRRGGAGGESGTPEPDTDAHRAGRTAALAAVPFAAAAGWAALPGSSVAAPLLLAAAAAGIAAAAAQIALRVVAPALVAVGVTAIPSGYAP